MTTQQQLYFYLGILGMFWPLIAVAFVVVWLFARTFTHPSPPTPKPPPPRALPKPSRTLAVAVTIARWLRSIARPFRFRFRSGHGRAQS